MDVKRRWLCTLVTSCGDVRRYGYFSFLQWFLPIIVQYQYQFALVEVTWQQDSKQINKSIIVSTEHVSVAVCSCKRCERKRKWRIEVPDLSHLECGAVWTGKKRRLSGDTDCIFRIEQWKNNGFLFTKIGNFCLLSQIINTYFWHKLIFQIPSFNMTIRNFMCWNTYHFQNIFEIHFSVVLIFFNFLYFATLSFYSVLKKKYCSGLFPLKFSQPKISVLQYYTWQYRCIFSCNF